MSNSSRFCETRNSSSQPEAGVQKKSKGALDPTRIFHDQVKDEVTSYERLKQGRLAELENLHGIGQMLIGVRVAMGLSQRELAEKLGVHESQISRDECNEYYGITVERAARILDALGVETKTRVEKIPQLAKSA